MLKKNTKKVKIGNIYSLKNILIILAVACFSFAGYFVFLSKASGPVTNTYNAPNIYLSPTTQPLPASQTFTVQVRANSGTTNVNAVQTDFTYPASLIDLVSIDTSTSAYQTGAVSSGANGNVSIARGQIGGLTGDQLVATITFKSKTTGGVANFQFTNGTSLLSSSTNVNILPGLSSAYGATYKVDTTPPNVALTSPANGSNIEYGSSQNITATASDDYSDVQKVEIYIDGILKSTLTVSPYTYSWSTAGLSEGSHTIYAKATDQFNFTAQTATNTVNVADKTKPTVSLSSPVASANVSGSVAVTAAANDNSGGKGIAKVDFYAGPTLIGTDATSPYSISWDSKTVQDGSYSLTAKASDASGAVNVATSSAVAITVDNADNIAPSQPGSFKTTSVGLSVVSLSWTASTDNIGVANYRLSRNGQQVYLGSGLTYSNSGLANSTAYNYSLVAIDAAGNSSTAATLNATTLTPKRGDVNGDNIINISDLSAVISAWSTNNATYDINKNGVVDIADLSIVLSNWGL